MDCASGAGASAGGDRLKVSDFREQILQLAGLACHEEEKSQTELLEKLRKCNKRTLVELCRSFDIPGSTGTKKDELVTIVMEFLMEHCSGVDGPDPDKKVKKRKRQREGVNLSGAKPSKKNKLDGTILETHGEAEADGRKVEEGRTNYSEFPLKDNINECARNTKGQFPKEKANSDPSERVNGSVSENLDVVSLTELLVPTNEQGLVATPSTKLVSNVEDDEMGMRASTRKSTSVTNKKATLNSDHKEKSCGKKVPRGDAGPRKQAVKPSKDELRQAVFFILETANFATMTFGDVVKAVDKYFGKDLFERKPQIRALIEEELFRLAEEAEKKELEEEEAKARSEKAAIESTKEGRVESDTEKESELQAGQDGESKDSENNDNRNCIEKCAKSDISVKANGNRNNKTSAESSQDGRAEVDTNNEDNCNKFTMDVNAETVVQNANGDDGAEMFRDGKSETAKKEFNGNAVCGSETGKAREENGTEDGRTEEWRSGNDSNAAENVGDCEPEASNGNETGEHVNILGDDKAQRAGDSEGSENVVSHGPGCDRVKDTIVNVNTEQSPADADDDGKAKVAKPNEKNKDDVDSSKYGTAENGKTMDDAKTNEDGQA